MELTPHNEISPEYRKQMRKFLIGIFGTDDTPTVSEEGKQKFFPFFGLENEAPPALWIPIIESRLNEFFTTEELDQMREQRMKEAREHRERTAAKRAAAEKQREADKRSLAEAVRKHTDQEGIRQWVRSRIKREKNNGSIL